MIKSGPYIQMIQFFAYNKGFVEFYAANESISLIETAKRFDELKECHNKLKKEGDMFNIYPHHNMDKFKLWQQEILDVCHKFNISVHFFEKGTLEFRRGHFCYYKYQHINITDLIVFLKNRKPISVSG